ncbi:hypothetical protein N7451_012179 [Penicillium sp. IBT 35674x]|nr:hypothetical protein N7451_012179 [Penicillium sp. IBT 35674x]
MTDDVSAAPKKTRSSRPKVRTGCITCKARRVKCDETKPACVRCTTTGRRCDGYAPLKTSFPEYKALAPARARRFPTPYSNTINYPEQRDVVRSRDQYTSDNNGGTSMPQSLPNRVEDILPSLSHRTHQGVNFYFDYYRQEGSRRWFPMGHGTMLKWLLQQALDQPLVLEVILSASAYNYAIVKQTQGACDYLIRKSVQDAFLIRSRVIQSLQHIIMRPSELFSEPVALVLSQLLVTEALEANIKAVDAHVEGLKTVIRALGGLSALGEATLTSIYCCDPIRSLMKKSPPEFAICQRWEKAALKPSRYRVNEAHARFPALGSQFECSSWSKSIHPQLKTILQSFQDIISIYEVFLLVEAENKFAHVDHKFTLLSTHRLISLPFDHEISSLDDTIRLATLAYVFARIWNFQGKRCIEYLLQDLLQRIVETQLAQPQGSDAAQLFWESLFN